MNPRIHWPAFADLTALILHLALGFGASARADFDVVTPGGPIHAPIVRIEGTVSGIVKPMWFEIHAGDASGPIVDFGAFAPDAAWSFDARHLREGDNTVKVFAIDAGGATLTRDLVLTLRRERTPQARPRPIPAELWWGGLGNNRQLLDHPADWTFVQQHADGYFFHTYTWGAGEIDVMQGIIAMTAPHGGRFIAELGGAIALPLSGWSGWMHIAWGSGGNGWVAYYGQNAGLILTEATHDTHVDNAQLIAQDDLDLTGDGVLDRMVYDLWGNYQQLEYAASPHLKHAHTSSPVWWRWREHRPLKDTDDFDTLQFWIGGREYRLNMAGVMERWRAAAFNNSTHGQWTFFTDCPYYTMTWPDAPDGSEGGTAVRAKIRAYEAWLHEAGARHAFVCNEDPGAALATSNPALWHQRFATNSLLSLQLHQREGGRADRYVFESWYMDTNNVEMPSQVTPETTPYTYTWLAREAICYLKGLRYDGSAQTLSLIREDGPQPTSQTLTASYTLTNTGDRACLPALAAFEDGDPSITLQWTGPLGEDITGAVMSGEGWVPAALLAPSQSVTIDCEARVPGEALTKVVYLEAFWNPQDPTGLVRARSGWLLAGDSAANPQHWMRIE